MVPLVDLARQHAALKVELMAAMERVLDSTRFILGVEGEALEAEVAKFCGVRHAIGVASGTDALRVTLAALGIGPGAEVITPAFSFVASSSTILMAGATPVFADIVPDIFALDPRAVERAITPRTKVVMPVHLYGHPAAMEDLTHITRQHGLALIEDAAQAIGAAYHGRPVGTWGDAACLSFYPTKNLGACGDAGMILTNHDDLAARARRLRHHGDGGRYRHLELGWCSRLDELQAAILRVKLGRLGEWIDARRRIADRYREGLSGLPLGLPTEHPDARHVYYLYTVRHLRRERFIQAMTDLGIGTAVHYPIPVPDQPMFTPPGGGAVRSGWPESARAAREVVSLPCYPELRDDEVDLVIRAVHEACNRARE
jgi:UDP-N-acetyl-3-dehydro-alpha-D-glucosamine 3-aminotranferase